MPRFLLLPLALLIPGSLVACSTEDPIDAAAVEREVAALDGVHEASGGCHDKEIFGRECTVRVTLRNAASADEITEVLERLREYAEEDVTLTVSVQDRPAISARVVEETEPPRGGRIIAAAVAEPAVARLSSSFASPTEAGISVEAPVAQAVALTQTVLGEGPWAATLIIEASQVAPSVQALVEDDDDLTDEVALVEAVTARFAADEVTFEDDAVSITLSDPDDDAAARQLAEALPAYDEVDSVEIGALPADATLDRRVEVAVEHEFPDVTVEKKGHLTVRLPSAARIAAVDGFLVEEFDEEISEIQLYYFWGDEKSLHRPVNPRDGFEFGLVERLAAQAWQGIEVEMPSELNPDRARYQLSGGRILSPREAGRLLALARADDQDLPVIVSGRFSDEFYYLTLDLTGDLPVAAEGPDEGLDELVAGWQAGVTERRDLLRP